MDCIILVHENLFKKQKQTYSKKFLSQSQQMVVKVSSSSELLLHVISKSLFIGDHLTAECLYLTLRRLFVKVL